MFERFTNRARHAVVLAQEESRALRHNFIGTEHLLLGLLGEPEGLAARALDRFGMSLNATREEVAARVAPGKKAVTGHIPFTPSAKKVLELALREALTLQHNYIGTEHLLLGLIREGKGVGSQVLAAQAGDLMAVRMAVLDVLPAPSAPRGRRWLRRLGVGAPGDADEPDDVRTTSAAGTSLEEAARLAGSQPVGSHHLLLATLADPDSAAARALATVGVDLDRARDALRAVDVTGTSDELPEEAGRRQMVVRVTDQLVIVETGDATLLGLAGSALDALGEQAEPPGTIRGDLAASASLGAVWQAIHDSLADIRRRAQVAATPPGQESESEDS
jgi:ATP-dependent Clp protease ATP-binding subunit ClpC